MAARKIACRLSATMGRVELRERAELITIAEWRLPNADLKDK